MLAVCLEWSEMFGSEYWISTPYRKARISTGTHWNSKTYLEIKWTSINSLNINLQLCAAQQLLCVCCVFYVRRHCDFPQTNFLIDYERFVEINFQVETFQMHQRRITIHKKHNTTIGRRFNAKPCFASEPVEMSFISQKHTQMGRREVEWASMSHSVTNLKV